MLVPTANHQETTRWWLNEFIKWYDIRFIAVIFFDQPLFIYLCICNSQWASQTHNVWIIDVREVAYLAAGRCIGSRLARASVPRYLFVFAFPPRFLFVFAFPLLAVFLSLARNFHARKPDSHLFVHLTNHRFSNKCHIGHNNILSKQASKKWHLIILLNFNKTPPFPSRVSETRRDWKQRVPVYDFHFISQ